MLEFKRVHWKIKEIQRRVKINLTKIRSKDRFQSLKSETFDCQEALGWKVYKLINIQISKITTITPFLYFYENYHQYYFLNVFVANDMNQGTFSFVYSSLSV